MIRLDWGRKYTCSRPAKVGDYCTQHSPEAAAARKKKRAERWAAADVVRGAERAVERAELSALRIVRRGGDVTDARARLLAADETLTKARAKAEVRGG